MRAYLKLVAIVLVSVAGQWLVERNIGWLDDAQFTARIMLGTCLGRPLSEAQMNADATALVTRQHHRAHGGRTPAEEYDARRAAGEFTSPRSDEPIDRVAAPNLLEWDYSPAAHRPLSIRECSNSRSSPAPPAACSSPARPS